MSQIPLEGLEMAALSYGAQKVPRGQAGVEETWKGTLITHKGQVIAFVKILEQQQIVSEIICSLLGRALGYNIPKPFLVSVTKKVLPDSQKWSQNEDSKLAFGSENAPYPDFRKFLGQRASQGIPILHRWSGFQATAIFDEWIANKDRHTGNLLYGGKNTFLLIDHSHAFTGDNWKPSDLQPDVQVPNKLLDSINNPNLQQAQKDEWRQNAITQGQEYDKLKLSELPDKALMGKHASADQSQAVAHFLKARISKITDLVCQRLGIPRLHMETKSDFPQIPDFQAEWSPVYMEPILGSGERITIGIAVQTPNGEVTVSPTLSEKKLRCAFGRNGLVLLDSASLCLDDLSKFSKENKPLQHWEAPLSGVELGPARPAAGQDMEEILRIAMQLTAAFGSASKESGSEKDLESSLPAQEGLDPWPEQIRKYVSREKPMLETNFYRMVNIVEGGTKTKFDYYGPRYVANFGKLFPLGWCLESGKSENLHTSQSSWWWKSQFSELRAYSSGYSAR